MRGRESLAFDERVDAALEDLVDADLYPSFAREVALASVERAEALYRQLQAGTFDLGPAALKARDEEVARWGGLADLHKIVRSVPRSARRLRLEGMGAARGGRARQAIRDSRAAGTYSRRIGLDAKTGRATCEHMVDGELIAWTTAECTTPDGGPFTWDEATLVERVRDLRKLKESAREHHAARQLEHKEWAAARTEAKALAVREGTHQRSIEAAEDYVLIVERYGEYVDRVLCSDYEQARRGLFAVLAGGLADSPDGSVDKPAGSRPTLSVITGGQKPVPPRSKHKP